MFTAIAFGLFKTYGAYRNPILFEELEVTNWLLQFANSSLVDADQFSNFLCFKVSTGFLKYFLTKGSSGYM